MGLLTTSGSLARVIGPVFVSFIYQEYGTWLLFGIVAASLGLSFVITTLAYRQLVPFDQMDKNRPFFEQIKFWKGWTGIWQTGKVA
jgi:ceroid-lipofuscinosis MFS transporter 7